MLCSAVAEWACNVDATPSTDMKDAAAHKQVRSPPRKQGVPALPPLLARRAPIRSISFPTIIDTTEIAFVGRETMIRLRPPILKSWPHPHHPRSADKPSCSPT